MASNSLVEKKLNKKDLFFMAMGQTIGAGIITNTGIAIGLSGTGVLIAYFLAFFVSYMGNLPNLLFATVHPVASPAYVMTSFLDKKVAGFWLYCQLLAAHWPRLTWAPRSALIWPVFGRVSTVA